MPALSRQFSTHSPNLAQRIVRLASVSGFASLMTLLLSTLANMIVARSGGPTAYASFVAANMLYFVSAAFCDLSLSLALARYIAHAPELSRERNCSEEEVVASATTSVLLITGFLSLCVGGLLTWQFPMLERWLHLRFETGFRAIFTFGLMLQIASYIVLGAYMGLLKAHRVFQITISGVAFLLLYLAVWRFNRHWPLWGAVSVSYLTSGLVALGLAARDGLLGSPAPLRDLKPLLEGWGNSLCFTFFTIFSTWSDRWIIASQLSPVSLGLYSAANSIMQAALRVPNNIATSLVGASAKVVSSDINEKAHNEKNDVAYSADNILSNTTRHARFNTELIRYFGFFAAMVSVIIALNADLILWLLFGTGFLEARTSLLCLVPTLLFGAIILPFLSVLVGSSAVTNSLGVKVFLLLSLPLRFCLLILGTRHSGVNGAALAVTISDGILAVICIFSVRQLNMFFPWRILIVPVMTALAAIATGFVLVHFHCPFPLPSVIALLCFVPSGRVLFKAIKP